MALYSSLFKFLSMQLVSIWAILIIHQPCQKVLVIFFLLTLIVKIVKNYHFFK